MRSAQTVSMMACFWWNMSTLAAEDSSAEVINGVIASICTKRVRAARPLIRRRISWAVTAWLEAKTV
jgi:hypothetical protein